MTRHLSVAAVFLFLLVSGSGVAAMQPVDPSRDLAREIVTFGASDILERRAVDLSDAHDRRIVAEIVEIIETSPGSAASTEDRTTDQLAATIAKVAAVIGTDPAASVSKCLRESCDEAHVRFGPLLPSASEARLRFAAASSRKDRLALFVEAAAATRRAFSEYRDAQKRTGSPGSRALSPDACARLADLVDAMNEAASPDGKSGGEDDGLGFQVPPVGEAVPGFLLAVDTTSEMRIYLGECRKAHTHERK